MDSRVVRHARVLRVLGLELVRVGPRRQVALLGDGGVVGEDGAALGHAAVRVGERHAAVAEPEDIPAVAVGAGGRGRRGGGAAAEVKLVVSTLKVPRRHGEGL